MPKRLSRGSARWSFWPRSPGCGWGKLRALRRNRLDLEACGVHVTEQVQDLTDGTLFFGEPKSEAGRRTVAFPEVLVPELQTQLDEWAGPGPRRAGDPQPASRALLVETGCTDGCPAQRRRAHDRYRAAVLATTLERHVPGTAGAPRRDPTSAGSGRANATRLRAEPSIGSGVMTRR